MGIDTECECLRYGIGPGGAERWVIGAGLVDAFSTNPDALARQIYIFQLGQGAEEVAHLVRAGLVARAVFGSL
jgi:hypothetical protein